MVRVQYAVVLSEADPCSRGSVQAQANHCDCGLFVLTYFDFFTEAPPLEGLALKRGKGVALDVAMIESAPLKPCRTKIVLAQAFCLPQDCF